MPETSLNFQRELQRAYGEMDQLRHALADSNRAREELRGKLHDFARELRVPLTSVLGFTDLLSVTHKGNPTELNQIAKAGHQLMKLIEQIEETAAIDHGSHGILSSHGSDSRTNKAPESRTVLHIEDNETNFRLIESILEDRANLNLVWACNGAEGMAFALQHRPALILLDLNLPDTHGSELLPKFKSNPLTENTPVIVLSADISPSQIERMLQAGARNYLTKPFDIKRLLCLVDEALAPAPAAA
jgi:CheY-like chemotaxis protein